MKKSKVYAWVVILTVLVTNMVIGSISVQVSAANGITRDYWLDVEGSNLSDIPLNSAPSGTDVLLALQTAQSLGDNYASRIRGFLTPAVTGDYTFYISSDDSSAIWLSTDYAVANKKKIAYLNGYASQYEFNKYATQQSQAIHLVAGTKYYIEVLHKEGIGDDHLEVAWERAGMDREIISGSYLTTYDEPDAPTNPEMDDINNTIGWTNVTGFNNASDYEYSTDKGKTWQGCTSNPQPLPNYNFITGQVMVRIKETPFNPPGKVLASNAPIAVNITPVTEPGKTLLWRIGNDDNDSTEFSDFRTANPETITVPSDWSIRTDWTNMSKGMDLTKNPTLKIIYNLDTIPAHGVEMSVRILDAYYSVPQMFVYSNDTMAGVIQVAGLAGGGSNEKFKYNYRLYIPKELLKTGTNELKLEVDRGFFTGTATDQYYWYEWDCIRLESLDGPAIEPIHGKYTSLGTQNLKTNTMDVLKWLGIAYSGNMMRSWPDREELEILRDMNFRTISLTLGYADMQLDDVENGELTSEVKGLYNNILSKYGDLLGYLEVQNEPGVFETAYVANLAAVKYMYQQRPFQNPWVKLVGPGWCYWPTGGEPSGWERNPYFRRSIDDYCDLINGHSYYTSFGGEESVVFQTKLAYPEYTGDGLPKPMVITETGANVNSTDITSKFDTYPYRHVARFDRELRMQVSYSDYPIQFQTYWSEFGMLEEHSDQALPDSVEAHIYTDDFNESAVKVYRRLALAYATHGKPLDYTVNNAAELAGKRAYFRAVDTSQLEVTNTGGTSDKILLNFVNFEKSAVNMNINVTLPTAGTYVAERYGAGNSYGESHSTVELTATPNLSIYEANIGAGESVQYILTLKETTAPTTPVLEAEIVSYKQVNLSWSKSSDNVKVTGYNVYDNGVLIAKLPQAITHFSHKELNPGSNHIYTVKAIDDSGNQSASSNAISLTTPAMPITPWTDLPGGIRRIEAELCELEGTNLEDYFVGMYFTGDINILGAPIWPSTNFTIKFNYKCNSDTVKAIYINDQFDRNVTLVNTGGEWNTVEVNIPANPENVLDSNNIITIRNTDYQFTWFDWFEIRIGTIDETPQQYWTNIDDDSSYIVYSSGFTKNEGANIHETSIAGEWAGFGFTGTGFRWYSDFDSTLGMADIYIDDVYETTVDLRTGLLGSVNIPVYEKMGLDNGKHIVKIVNKSGHIKLYSVDMYAVGMIPETPGPDVVIKDIFAIDANDNTNITAKYELTGTREGITPYGGQSCRLVAVVKNIGLLSTPENFITSGVFMIDGETVGWHDKYDAQIQPGQSVRLVSNGGPDGIWNVPGGERTYVSGMHINDINRYAEMNTENNIFTKGIYVVASAPLTESVNIASQGIITASVTTPTGGGNHDIEVIRDGIKPEVGETDSALQYDTYNGNGGPDEQGYGYTFGGDRTFNKVVLQEGKHFSDGGWFKNGALKVQVRQNGIWNDVSASISPSYPYGDTAAAFGSSFETYTFTFNNVTGDGIRIFGTAGGSNRFISIGELEVYAVPHNVSLEGTITASVTSPTGSGSYDISVIRDGVKPDEGSTNSSTQYDTYNGGAGPDNQYYGYTYTSNYHFTKVVFQEGMHFNDGGWFKDGTLKVQVRQEGVWNDVTATVTPSYPDADTLAAFGNSFETYTFNLGSTTGDGIRIYGTAGGTNKFVSIGELEVWAVGSEESSAPVNLALNKPVIAISEGLPLYPASQAVDGNDSTRWEANDWADGDWIVVDLEAVYTLTGTELLFPGDNNVVWKYTVKVSTDNTNWITVVDKSSTGVGGGSYVIDSFDTTARYVKVTNTQFTGSYWPGINEIRVLGYP